METLEEQVARLDVEMTTLKAEMERNTSITSEIHQKNDEMYQAFATAKNAIKVLAKVGDGVMWLVERGKHVVVFVLGLVALVSMIKTGKVPEWVLKLLS